MNLEGLQGLDDFTGFEGGAPTSYSSPGMPSVYDVNPSASSSTSNMGTVSPQDLLLQDPYMSAPNSTALTTLTSPSVYNESPGYDSSYDVSPNFGTNDFDPHVGDSWFPLFPQDNTAQQMAPAATGDQSPAEISDELEVGQSSGRRKSGQSRSPPSGRHSSVSGVNSRNRNKPLPPIVVEDPHDTIAMKRARNTLAARKSRERKAQKLEDLEEKIEKLTAERDHWKKIALGRGG